MHSTLKVAALVVATMGLMGKAQAQDMDLMTFADTDMDGKVTTAEYAAFSEAGWGFFSNGADKIKVADLDDMAKGAFVGITPDANGEVTKAVYTAAIPGRFKMLDKNGDGTLSAAELNAPPQPAA